MDSSMIIDDQVAVIGVGRVDIQLAGRIDLPERVVDVSDAGRGAQIDAAAQYGQVALVVFDEVNAGYGTLVKLVAQEKSAVQALLDRKPFGMGRFVGAVHDAPGTAVAHQVVDAAAQGVQRG